MLHELEAVLDIPPLILAAALVVTLVAATVQGTIGLGFAIFSVPLLSLLDPRLAPVPQLLLSMPLALTMMLRERHAIEIRGIAWVLVGRILGAGLGATLLLIASGRTLDLFIGAVVLGAVFALSSTRSLTRTSLTELAAGVTSGTGGIVSAIGGPPLALLYRNERGDTLRANLAAIFVIGQILSVSGRLIAGKIVLTELFVALAMLPGLFAGLLISRRLITRVNQRMIRTGVLAVSTVAALGLIGRALL